jgi:hypothetical protein
MLSETRTAASLLLLQQDQSDVAPDKQPNYNNNNNNTLRCSFNNLTQVVPLPSLCGQKRSTALLDKSI